MNFVIPTMFEAIDRFSRPVGSMADAAASFADRVSGTGARIERSLNNFGDKALTVAKTTGAMGLAIVAPLGLAANAAIKFEDKLADIGKTTNLEGAVLASFGQELRNLSNTTRNSIDELLTIGEIGGRLGVAKTELMSFTAAADKFSIALASDYGGGVEEAISSVSKLQGLFAQTREMSIADSIIKSGSAINELGAKGLGTSQNINDFMLRMGALPDAIKPSLTDVAALGGFFEKAGIDSQIASSGMTNLLKAAGEGIGSFATQMKMGTRAAADLLASDPTVFTKRFASSLNGLAPDILADKLQTLKIGSNEVLKVVGALGAGTDLLTNAQLISASAFEKGNSLTDEAAKKNATTAGQIQMAKNNFENLAITIGTQLVPIIGKFLNSVLPVLTAVGDWMTKHEGLMSVIVPAAGILGGLLLTISGFATVIGIVTKGIAAWEVVQKVLNFTMKANPIGAIITIIGLLIAAIAIIADNTEGWGTQWDNTVTWMGSIFDTFVGSLELQWLLLSSGFTSLINGIVKGWKYGMNAIGQLSDEQYAKDIARMDAEELANKKMIQNKTADLAASASKMLAGPGWAVTVKQGEIETPKEYNNKPALNPHLAQQSNQQSFFKDVVKQNIKITVEAAAGTTVKDVKSPNGIPVTLSKTFDWMRK